MSQIDNHGMHPEQEHLPTTPDPGRGEVRVRLCWLRLPAVSDAAASPALGDGAGVIDAVGAGVPEQSLGLPVWIWDGRGGCVLAPPYMTLPAMQAVPLPDGVPLDAAACLGTPALAAMHAAIVDGGVAGKRVLVAGGGIGAVGHYALQFARLAGAAQVIASVGSAIDAGIAQDAGAHATLIDGEAGLAQRVAALTDGQGVDRVIEADAGANLARDLELVRDDGDIVVVHGSSAADIALPLAGMLRRNLRLRFVDVHALGDAERRRAVFELQAWLERGLIRHRIGARLPLSRLAEARELARGAAGHVLLAVD